MKPITDAAIKAAIRRASVGKKPVILKDPGPRGAGRLSLQARPSAGGSTAEWYAVYYRQGRRVQAKLGTYPAISLAGARERFSADYGPAITAGTDPRAKAREAARLRAKTGTVKDLFSAYIEHMKAAGRKSWREYEKALLTGSYAAAKSLGEDTLACDVVPADISAHLGTVYRRGAASQADHIRSYMGAAFSWGVKADNDYRQKQTADVRWGILVNPVSAVPKDQHATKPGERHLSINELRDFWFWLDRQEGHSARVLQLMIATGQRVQMLTAIGPRHFDTHQRTLTWEGEQTKNDKPHVLPLPGRALSIIKGLKIGEKDTLYFPQRSKRDRPVTHFTVSDMCRDYCSRKDFDGEPFTPRDLRRTWKTLAGLAGVSKEMRDRLQHHAMRDVGSRHYDRYDYFPEKREAMKRWSAWLDRTLAQKKGRTGVAVLRNSAG